MLGEFVGAQLLLVYGDAETGAERDVEVAVVQGGRQVVRLRAGEQQVVQHQLGELDAVAQRAGGHCQVQLGRDLDAQPRRRARGNDTALLRTAVVNFVYLVLSASKVLRVPRAA